MRALRVSYFLSLVLSYSLSLLVPCVDRYVDRSLYETVHFWKEPLVPISVADSLVLIESKEPSGEEGEGTMMMLRR